MMMMTMMVVNIWTFFWLDAKIPYLSYLLFFNDCHQETSFRKVCVTDFVIKPRLNNVLLCVQTQQHLPADVMRRKKVHRAFTIESYWKSVEDAQTYPKITRIVMRSNASR